MLFWWNLLKIYKQEEQSAELNICSEKLQVKKDEPANQLYLSSINFMVTDENLYAGRDTNDRLMVTIII